VDHRFVVSGGDSGAVFLWKTDTAKSLAPLQGHKCALCHLPRDCGGAWAGNGALRAWEGSGRAVLLQDVRDCVLVGTQRAGRAKHACVQHYNMRLKMTLVALYTNATCNIQTYKQLRGSIGS
jgi:hypothetical protein